jgi:mRNA interferase HigB
MRIKNKYLLDKFEKKHVDSVRALQKFIDIVEEAQWHNLNDIKVDFNSVDYVSNERYVFNIKGNNYRIIAVIIFIEDVFTIRFIGTHAEYSKINAKKI